MSVEQTTNLMKRGRADITFYREIALYEEILLIWVNLPGGTEEEFDELISAYPKVFRDQTGAKIPKWGERDWIIGVREYLRAAWSAPNRLDREWYVYKLRDIYAREARPPLAVIPAGEDPNANVRIFAEQIATSARERGFVQPPPPRTFFDDVLIHFLTISNRAVRCARAGCRNPFFFKGKGVKTQSYCEECRVAATHDRQNRYWEKRGKEERDKRRKLQKRAAK